MFFSRFSGTPGKSGLLGVSEFLVSSDQRVLLAIGDLLRAISRELVFRDWQ